MLSFLPSPILLLLNLILIPLNAILIATPVMLLGIVRLCLPHSFTKFIESCNYVLYLIWVYNNDLIIKITCGVHWHISGDEVPELHGKSCVVISNHMSWADIVLLGCLYQGKIPTTKFFMKHSLIYIPFVGLACYAMGMPFLRRYSQEELLKNPSLRKRDIESTKKACRRLVYTPSSLINFAEGTRFTPEKAAKVNSPYAHLMPPKAASVAIALGEIGKDIDYIFNTTLVYPEHSGKPFLDLLKGRLPHVYADIRVIRVTSKMTGDYLHDKVYKHNFTMCIRELWKEKDELIGQILSQHAALLLKGPAPAATATAMAPSALQATTPAALAAAAAGSTAQHDAADSGTQTAREPATEQAAQQVEQPELKEKTTTEKGSSSTTTTFQKQLPKADACAATELRPESATPAAAATPGQTTPEHNSL